MNTNRKALFRTIIYDIISGGWYFSRRGSNVFRQTDPQAGLHLKIKQFSPQPPTAELDFTGLIWNIPLEITIEFGQLKIRRNAKIT